MLKAAGLECMRGDRILFSNVKLELDAGELLHVKGLNGSGKTSLIRMLCGLVMPNAGEIFWGGESISDLKEDYLANLLYIGHHLGVKAELTGLENLKINAALGGHPISEDQAWDALEKIGLRGREDLPAKVLSQGQKRRVALARMLVTKAKLWILDEPFTALDVDAVKMLEGVLNDHLHQGGMVILTTHQAYTPPKTTVKYLQLGEAT
ncbi:MAG: cytochrome c biogenesis heme-transporting ATPase CcmA [Gammaproteobacteria bacterium]|nr:cytochrome c biogenesis heme-transporting ATPase CcmA [Gammaproteobacteria bacterium]MDH5693066.1 cytochrome c biogenesis heme-transporting ATPase CcmA [Gammaproteobacteria bacterium]